MKILDSFVISPFFYRLSESSDISDLPDIYNKFEISLKEGSLNDNSYWVSINPDVDGPSVQEFLAAFNALDTPVSIFLCLSIILDGQYREEHFHYYALRRLGEVIKFYPMLLRAAEIHCLVLAKTTGKLRLAFDRYLDKHEQLGQLMYKAVRVATINGGNLKLTAPNNHYIYNNCQKLTRNDIHIYKLENPSICVSFTFLKTPSISIYNQHDDLIWCSGEPVDKSSIDKNVNLEKEVYFIDDRFTNFNICHFLFDKLPLYELFTRYVGRVRNVFLSSSNDYINTFLRLYNLQNVASDLETGESKCYTMPVLYLSSTSLSKSKTTGFHPAGIGADWAVDFIKSYRNLMVGNVTRGERIYISRKPGFPRTVVNNNEVTRFLVSKGFTVIDPGEFDAADQVSIFKDCKLLVGVHGAGLTNLAFMERGAVIELLPPLCATTSYFIPANVLGHYYTSIICDDPELKGFSLDYQTWEHDVVYNRRNIYVNIDTLDKVISQLI